MKRFKIIFTFTFLAIFLISCEDDLVESSYKSNNNGSIINGRLFFQSKEEFNKVYKNIADKDEIEISKYFMPLYEKGFYSLIPIATENNERFLANHYNKLNQKNNLGKNNFNKDGSSALEEETVFDYFDDLEDIIGDVAFASFLNSDAEIQIANDIYKYTDVGLFITKDFKYDDLLNYLESTDISKNLQLATSDVVKNIMRTQYPISGLTSINSDISYFKLLYIDPSDVFSENGGGGGYNPTAGSVTATDPSFSTFINQLQYCEPHSGLFGNLFGENNVCIDRYESRRRVKTKAFNYNYLLVYHLGVKCVHQYKGNLGLWRVEAAEEIRLVVEAAQFEYDLDAITGNTAVNNLTKERAYFLNNQKILYQPNTMTLPNWGTPSITYVGLNSLPELFQDDLTIEFFSTGWDYLDNLVQDGIDDNTKASQFNEWFYNGLYSTVTSQIQSALNSQYSVPSNRTFAAKFPENGKVLIQKSVFTQGFGNGIAQRTFDFGAQMCFNVGYGSNGWTIQPDLQCNVYVNPTNFRVKIIGAVRSGSQWHGSKFNVGIN